MYYFQCFIIINLTIYRSQQSEDAGTISGGEQLFSVANILSFKHSKRLFIENKMSSPRTMLLCIKNVHILDIFAHIVLFWQIKCFSIMNVAW